MKKYLLVDGFEGDYLAIYDTRGCAINAGIERAKEAGSWECIEDCDTNIICLDDRLMRAIKDEGNLNTFPDLLIHDLSDDSYSPFDKMVGKMVKPVYQDERAIFPYDVVRFYLSGDAVECWDDENEMGCNVYHTAYTQADLLGIIEIEKILDEEEILNQLEYYIREIEYFPSE